MKHCANSFAVVRKISIAVLLLLGIGLGGLTSMVSAQRIAPVNQWTAYTSHNSPKQIVKVGDEFYVISKGGLFTYNLITKKTRSFTSVEGMSQIDPTAIHYHAATGKFFVGFSDGMINTFTNPEDGFGFVSDIQRTELYPAKTINKMISIGDLLYIATEFGVVIYDIPKEETRATVTKVGGCPTGVPVRDIHVFGDSIFVAMGEHGAWRASYDHPNLTLPSAWNEVTGSNGLQPGHSNFLASTDSKDYLEIEDTLYHRNRGTSQWSAAPIPPQRWRYVKGWGDYLLLTYSTVIRIVAPGGQQSLVFARGNTQCGYVDSNLVMIGDTVTSLSKYLGVFDSLEAAYPPGPYNNKVTALAVGNQEFYVGPEGKGGSSAPAGNTDGFWHFNPNKGWHRFDVDDELSRDSVWAEFARGCYQLEDSVCYMGSWNHGVIRLQAGKITHVWTPMNSNLNNGVGNSIRISALAVDKSKNLWATGIVADFNLNVFSSEDSVWYPYSLGGTYPIGMVIDDWGSKWINNQGLGITVFNENGTLDVTTDDKVKRLTSEIGRGGLPTNTVYSMVKDLRGQIWVGTLEGVAVFANPSAVFNTTFPDASCPVIEGFCLLRDQRVNAIVVDGANRKWIGTDNGLYVVNPQGNRLVVHYTVDNSPLFSNQILELQIDQQTGEIFVGTSKGLLSLMGEAVGGMDNSDSLYVYPNPVAGDYDGPIAITSSYKDVEVKITTVSGRLVRALSALGGQAIWDGNDAAGNRVTPGVYLAMVADKEGKNSGIAKFVILERNP
ncbi:MAG: hypothetical protein KAY96_00685 [Bacteroidia bacterium]|nr:hypothetical protein [Bacteroidia bacterium]MBP6722108.1 hypothetical protein [Bacteroidia bacterium]MBP8073247.1 hypothetical protein [Bacteroidia bacterium]